MKDELEMNLPSKQSPADDEAPELFSIFEDTDKSADFNDDVPSQDEPAPHPSFDAKSDNNGPVSFPIDPLSSLEEDEPKKKKKKGWLVPVIVFICLLMVTGGFAALFFTGILPQKIGVGISDFLEKLRVPDTVMTSTQLPYALSAHKNALPDNANGVYIDLSTVLSEGKAVSQSSFNDILEEDFSFLKNFITDTLLLRPEQTGETLPFSDDDGKLTDVTREYLNAAKLRSMFTVLFADDALLYNAKGKCTDDFLKPYLNNYGFDALLISADNNLADGSINDTVSYFSDLLNKQAPDLYFGVELQTTEQAEALLEECSVDFIVCSSAVSIKGGFASYAAGWDAFAKAHPEVYCYCKHHFDLVTKAAGWTSANELGDQVKCLWDMQWIRGSFYQDLSSLRLNPQHSTLNLSSVIYADYPEGYDLLELKNAEYDETTDKIRFYGGSNTKYKAYCNRNALAMTKGEFTYEDVLSPGSNVFDFFAMGIHSPISVFKSVPFMIACPYEEEILLDQDQGLYIRAVCLKDCSVKCTVGDRQYEMYPVVVPEETEIPDGYCLFGCQISFHCENTTPTSLGDLIISAARYEFTQQKTCASITLTEKPARSSDPAVTPELHYFDNGTPAIETENTELQPSPYDLTANDRQMMVRVTYDNAEQLGPADDYNTYHADLSTLCEGTVDYIQNINANEEDGILRYELRSGINVYARNCELIVNGQEMPLNRIYINHVDDSAYNCTDVYFTADWTVPITVQCKPQNYHTGYSSYSFNIDAFTAQYVDVRFCYTKEFYNLSSLQFSDKSPFSGCELYAQEDDSLLLRLYLKKQGQFYGYDLERLPDGQMKLSFKKHSDGNLKGKIVMIDAGHGGLSMTGTALADNSLPEKTVTLSIARKAKEILERRGATVLMTRTRDTAIELYERTRMLKDEDPDIYVSIHCDGSVNKNECGTHTFYFRPYSMPLAAAIHASLTEVWTTKIYDASAGNRAYTDKEIKYYPFYVTRQNHCPSVLVETGFMTNPTEGRLLAQESTQSLLAEGIADGIEAYFRNNY